VDLEVVGAFTVRETLVWSGAFLAGATLVGFVGGSLGVPFPVLAAGGIATAFVLVLARVVWMRRRP
jgi:hypothetical protein